MSASQETIQNDIQQNDVVLYMKGTKEVPQCGFSAQVVNILNLLKVEFLDRNVLEEDALRQGIKEFSDWPTIPQLYIRGTFIGGCDIVVQLYQSGDLEKIITKEASI